MKIFLSGADTLKLFESLLKNPLPDAKDQENILSKLKLNLLNSLEKQDSIEKESSYKLWQESEEKRIAELKAQMPDLSKKISAKEE